MEREESVAGRAKAEATNKINVATTLRQTIAQDANVRVGEKLDSGKQRAANQTEKFAGVVERAAQDLRDGELGPLSDYAASSRAA